MATPVIDPRIPTEPEGSQTTRPAIDLVAAAAAPEPVPMSTAPIPALWDDDDGLPALGDDDDDGQVGGLVRLAEYRPGADAPRTPQQQPRRGGPSLYAPPPAEEERLDDRYRIAQVQRQQESDLDWLMRFTGGYPPPQQQPAASAAPTPQAPAAPERGVMGTAAAVAAETPWWLANMVGQIPGGAVSMGGGALQAPDVVASGVEHGGQAARIRQLDLMDRIDRGERVRPVDDVYGYQDLTAEQRAHTRSVVQNEVAAFDPTPIRERVLFQAGESIKNWARNWIPYVEGYGPEDWSSMIGSGLGSLIAGIPVSLATGPVGSGTFFAGIGLSEATERAVQFDKQERAAGRHGLTEEQIALAGLSGVIPGATDAAPVEVLLGRLKLPGITPAIQRMLAQAIAKAGGAALIQAGIEGLQEGVQQTLQNLISQGYNPDQGTWQDVLKSMGVGFAVGGIAGGVTGGGLREPGAIGACCAGVASDRGARG